MDGWCASRAALRFVRPFLASSFCIPNLLTSFLALHSLSCATSQPAKPSQPSRWTLLACDGRSMSLFVNRVPSPPTHALRSVVRPSLDQLCRAQSCIVSFAAAAVADRELIEPGCDVICCFDTSYYNTSHTTPHLSLLSLSRCESLQLQGHDDICVEGFCSCIPGVSSKLACA